MKNFICLHLKVLDVNYTSLMVWVVDKKRKIEKHLISHFILTIFYWSWNRWTEFYWPKFILLLVTFKCSWHRCWTKCIGDLIYGLAWNMTRSTKRIDGLRAALFNTPTGLIKSLIPEEGNTWKWDWQKEQEIFCFGNQLVNTRLCHFLPESQRY